MVSRSTLMSSLKPQQLTLSPKAHQDFIDILRYTGETWGEKQLLAYRDKIFSEGKMSNFLE